jgi:5-methyltetrahydrofolate--homocysteine methyltransferase
VAPSDPDELHRWFTDPEIVIPRLERTVARTHWGGDAFPRAFPLSPGLPAIEAAYLGCPYRVVPGSNTGWAGSTIDDWDTRAPIAVDPDNWWWRTTQKLLAKGAEAGVGRYTVGIPDIQGGGEIVVLMRGTERMATDLLDHPDAVKQACAEEIHAWRYYYETSFEIIHQHQPGYVDWIGIWSEKPYVSVENDFSIMISPAMFEEFFVPALRLQTEWVDRTIYHLDGPGAIRHLDLLLALPDLDGIQWVPGAGAASMIEWLTLLKRIQQGGKRLHLGARPWEVVPLLEELDPAGVVISTSCASVDDADRLLDEVDRMFAAQSR